MYKMYSEAYKDWIEVFTDDLLEIWQKERNELQKASMLLCALQKELKNVQTNVEVEIINIRQQLKYKNNLKDKINSLSPYNEGKKNSPNTINKENECNVTADILEGKSNFNEIESPDLFKNVVSQCSTETSVIDLSVSDEDVTKSNGSPTIKRRRRHYNKNKFESPALISSDINGSKRTISTPTKTVCNKNLVKANLFKTPVAKSDNDLSVIENTPEVSTKKLQTNSKVVGKTSRKKIKSGKAGNVTLTQMMGRTKRKLQLTTNKNAEHEADSDETYFEDTKDGSTMGITDLLSYINKDATTTLQEEKSHVVDRGNDNTTYCELNMNSSEEIDEFSKGAIFNETEIATSSEKPKLIPPEPEPIVRGRARKQLQGWACEKCKNFYGTMKLSPEELKKRMDECSRHRYKYHPPQDTLPGFWDLSIPPEKPK